MKKKSISNVFCLAIIMGMICAFSIQPIKATTETDDGTVKKNMGGLPSFKGTVFVCDSLRKATKEDFSTKSLSICGHVNPEDWQNLRNFKALQSLSLKDVNQVLFKNEKHKGSFLSILETLKIIDLDLSGKLIWDVDLKRLPQTLTSLNLSRTLVYRLADLKERCPNLASLDVSYTIVSKKSILDLFPLKKLKYLSVKQTSIQSLKELSFMEEKVLIVN